MKAGRHKETVGETIGDDGDGDDYYIEDKDNEKNNRNSKNCRIFLTDNLCKKKGLMTNLGKSGYEKCSHFV